MLVGGAVIGADVHLAADAELVVTTCAEHHAVLDSLHGEYGLQHSGSAHGVAVYAFEAEERHVCETSTVYGYALHLVVIEGGGAVYAHESNLVFV